MRTSSSWQQQLNGSDLKKWKGNILVPCILGESPMVHFAFRKNCKAKKQTNKFHQIQDHESSNKQQPAGYVVYELELLYYCYFSLQPQLYF